MPIALDDICYNKAAIIERALRRALEEYAMDSALENYTHIDAMTLNIERACQAAIDLAMHLVARDHLGSPQSSADSFRLLQAAGYIRPNTALALSAMVGFRNVAVHEYQQMELSILKKIGDSRWKDLVEYCRELGIEIRPGRK
ncbi:MAG: DUF86 domain-containing protein [Chitinivibrionales bacterium]|nr:DUF86 domain-containing protein [Chitinivibrionales bacterium]